MSKTIPEPFSEEILALCVKFLSATDDDEKGQAFYDLGQAFLSKVDDPRLVGIPEWAHQLARKACAAQDQMERELERISREVIRRAIGGGLVQRVPCPCPDCTTNKTAN